MSALRGSLESHLPTLTIFDAKAPGAVNANEKLGEHFVVNDPVAGLKRLIADAKSHIEQKNFENDVEFLSALVARQGGLGELATKFASMIA